MFGNSMIQDIGMIIHLLLGNQEMRAKSFYYHQSGQEHLCERFSLLPMVFLLLFPFIILYPLAPGAIDHDANGKNTGISPAPSALLTPEPDHSQWEWVEVSPPVQNFITHAAFYPLTMVGSSAKEPCCIGMEKTGFLFRTQRQKMLLTNCMRSLWSHRIMVGLWDSRA